jgi:S-adenosylmethionine-diacylgycerolhomoserine-N-methlytransferase
LSAVAPVERLQHRAFLNRYYGVSRHFYDLTRRYYLLGRDRVLDELAREDWRRLVEIGPGTGRNLRRLHSRRPDALLGGVDASDEMLAHARARCPFARLAHGFAEEADYRGLLGAPPDRVLFSYCLSMTSDPMSAVERARAQLAPGGAVVIVDFADLAGMSAPLRWTLRRWLATFHVTPVEPALLPQAASLRFGPGRYYLVARVPAA